MAEREHKSLSERVKANIEIVDECLIWKGAMSGNTPVVGKRREDGTYRNISVRFLFARKKFEGITERTRLKTSCGNPRCVHREHLELGTFVKKERRVRSGSPKTNMQLNKEVFTLAISMTADLMSEKVNYSSAAVRNILRLNTAMYPYFAYQLRQLRDVEAIRNDDRSDQELMADYKLSPFALNFIKQGNDYPLRDEDLFLKLLDDCEVHNDHLIWNGEFQGKTPITRTFKRGRKVDGLFLSAVRGGNFQEIELTCSCGYDGCVNPYHFNTGEIKDEVAE